MTKTPPLSSLTRPDGTQLAYDRVVPDTPEHGVGVIFMHGFQSDRNATKALALEAACRRHNLPFIRYDAYAHGQSEGTWEDFTISRAVHDALLVIDELTVGPQILMGSSMGGWVALRAMEDRPDRIHGVVGIATAPDFTAHLTPSADYTEALIADGPDNFVISEDWSFTGPVHLVQGQKDASVPWQTAQRVADKFAPGQATVTLIPDGDHRLNRPEDLEVQEAALLEVISRIKSHRT